MIMFFHFFMCDDLSFISTTQKTLKPSENCFNAQDEKKLHTRDFQLKGSGIG